MRKLMLSNDKIYLISRFINLIGSNIYNICIPLYLLEKFGSLTITGIFFTLVQIPMIVMLPFIGGFLKNKNLKHIMLISNAISIVIFILIYMNERSIGSSFFVFIILTMVEKVNVSVFNVSSQSSFSILFEKERIDSINSLKSVFDNFASLLGPTLGTLIYAKSNLSVIICINIISFIVCFILLMNLNYMHKSEPIENERNRKMNICAGLTYLKNNSNIMFIFFTFMVLNFLVAPTENVYAPGIIKVIFGLSDEYNGWASPSNTVK